MKLSFLAALLLPAANAAARSGLRSPELDHLRFTDRSPKIALQDLHARTEIAPRFLNKATSKFAVNGSAIPDVDFDVGESYAGLLPITDKADEQRKLFYWFFPTVNEEHLDDKEIVIWLTGGPGCSSLVALLQENGPFLWAPGLQAPTDNPWSWHRLTNVIWIEQPIGVGFSDGPITITTEDELAEQVLGFWKNFIETFGMQDYKVYIAVESYGGTYGPYIASHMLDANDKKYYDVQGLLIYDGLIADRTQNVQRHAGLKSFVYQHQGLLPFNDTFLEFFDNKSHHCGFDEYERQYLAFPPPEPAPTLPPGTKLLPNGTLYVDPDCALFFIDVYYAALALNACYDLDDVARGCPAGYDPLAYTLPDPYFDRADVKRAIHAPLNVTWIPCADEVFATPDGSDTSPAPDQRQLPQTIDATQNVIIAHGAFDIALPLNGALLAIQNMTWGHGAARARGFQEAPHKAFYVPVYDPEAYALELPTGGGIQGTTHTERGLTFVATALAGHQGPKDAAGSSFRHLEKLLGRIDSLSEVSGFTLPELRNMTQPQGPLTKGTVPIPCIGGPC